MNRRWMLTLLLVVALLAIAVPVAAKGKMTWVVDNGASIRYIQKAPNGVYQQWVYYRVDDYKPAGTAWHTVFLPTDKFDMPSGEGWMGPVTLTGWNGGGIFDGAYWHIWNETSPAAVGAKTDGL